MKALSVKQPWASAIVAGLKDVENRTWNTKHRGPILIHASKSGLNIDEIDNYLFPLVTDINRKYDGEKHEFKSPSDFYRVDGEELVGIRTFTEAEIREEAFLIANGDGLYFGAIVGAVNLSDVVEGNDSRWAESNCKHWLLENALEFSLPEFQISGKLGLWDFPIEKLNPSAQEELAKWR